MVGGLRLFAAAGCAVAISGCSTYLGVETFTEDDIPSGVVYYLPMVEFEIKLTRQLVRCDDADSTANDATVGVKMTAGATPRHLQDPTRRYRIDYETLSSALKKTDVTIELYENGTLKSINATVVDESRKVLANVLGGAAKLALVSAGLPAGGSSATGEPIDRNLCKADARQAIKDLKAGEASITKLQAAIEAKEKEIADTKDPARLKVLRAELKTLTDGLAAENKKRGKLVELLVDTQLYYFRPDAEKPQLDLLPSGKLEERWFTEMGRSSKKVKEAMLANAAVATGRRAASRRLEPQKNLIVYRQPADGILAICSGKPCMDSATGELQVPESERLLSTATPVPQLGVLATLAVRNGPFEDNVLKASFRPSGMLEKLEVSTKASATEASAAFKDSVDAIAKYKDLKRKEDVQKLGEQTDLLKAQKAQLDAELELEKSRKALDDFRAQD